MILDEVGHSGEEEVVAEVVIDFDEMHEEGAEQNQDEDDACQPLHLEEGVEEDGQEISNGDHDFHFGRGDVWILLVV